MNRASFSSLVTKGGSKMDHAGKKKKTMKKKPMKKMAGKKKMKKKSSYA